MFFLGVQLIHLQPTTEVLRTSGATFPLPCMPSQGKKGQLYLLLSVNSGHSYCIQHCHFTHSCHKYNKLTRKCKIWTTVCDLRLSKQHCWRFKPFFYEVQSTLYSSIYRYSTCPEFPLRKPKIQHCNHKHPPEPAQSSACLHNLFHKISFYFVITVQFNTQMPYFHEWSRG